MLPGKGIIKAAMTKRGYKHRISENQFSIRGEYTRNLQYAYSKERMTQNGRVVDLVYFAADVLNEKLVIGFYRENADLENGTLINASRALDLDQFNAKDLDRVLDQLVTPMSDKLR